MATQMTATQAMDVLVKHNIVGDAEIVRKGDVLIISDVGPVEAEKAIYITGARGIYSERNRVANLSNFTVVV